MKCQITSRKTHDVLINKEIGFNSYKEICSGEKKKVNLGYWGNFGQFQIQDNSIRLDIARKFQDNIYGIFSNMPWDWEVLSIFISIHNIEQNWLDCHETYGWYDEDLGGWTGCVGKV